MNIWHERNNGKFFFASLNLVDGKYTKYYAYMKTIPKPKNIIFFFFKFWSFNLDLK